MRELESSYAQIDCSAFVTDCLLKSLSVGPFSFLLFGVALSDQLGFSAVSGLGLGIFLLVVSLALPLIGVMHVLGSVVGAVLAAALGGQRCLNRVVLLAILCLCCVKSTYMYDESESGSSVAENFASTFVCWFWVASVFRLVKVDIRILVGALVASVFFWTAQKNVREKELLLAKMQEAALELKRLQDIQNSKASSWWHFGVQ